MGEQCDHREKGQQRRSGPLDRPLRPMPLRLEPQALTNLLESSLHLPASDKPRDYPPRIGMEVGAQESLGGELFLRVSDQHPAQRHSGQARAVPDRRSAKPPLQCASACRTDRKSTRLNSSHANISYAVFCLKKNNTLVGSAAE